jgi:hypothetical protein
MLFDHKNSSTRTINSGGSPDAMDKIIRMRGWIDLENEVDLIKIKASRDDICRN